MKGLLITILIISCQIMYSCTNIAVTKGASKDDSNVVMMTADAGDTDFRIIYVPAADHKPGTKRPVFKDSGNGQSYPRYNGTSFGPNYYIPELEKTEQIGSIEQVAHAYAYFDAAFGVMNEHQLAISECTCGAKESLPSKKNERIFDIVELSRVAMERCTTAEDAVKLMGSLAEKYGYYGWGEELAVSDKNKIWIFEICAEKTVNAFWAAKKVPEGNVLLLQMNFV